MNVGFFKSLPTNVLLAISSATLTATFVYFAVSADPAAVTMAATGCGAGALIASYGFLPMGFLSYALPGAGAAAGLFMAGGISTNGILMGAVAGTASLPASTALITPLWNA